MKKSKRFINKKRILHIWRDNHIKKVIFRPVQGIINISIKQYSKDYLRKYPEVPKNKDYFQR